ncbi:MAG: serine/threonine protein kinase, partial [Nannocystaceae bacterium]|nr:serine/threonine protein kinase [Nannocystaceae bacterium]
MTKTDEDERVSTWLAELARAPVPGEDELRALAPGDLLGRDRYRIHSELGRGGMGIVYEAGDTKLNRRVALKTHQVASVDARRRLLVEAQAMAKLSHPHVVAVHDVGEFEGGVFLVAALIRGGDLDTWRTAERSWSEVVDAYVEAGRGLAYALAAGLIHRDFKPSNVLVGLDGRSQVTDFGVAVPIDSDTRGDEPSGRRTEGEVATSSLVGTPAYMALEQFFGAPADARSDQFSFCVALCEALLGHRPYRTTSKELLTEPPRVRASKLHMPRRILRVVARGVSVEPSKRFPSMDALLDALERARAPRRTAWIATGGLGLVGLGALATVDLEPPCSEGIEPPLRAWSTSGRLRLKRVFLDDDQAKKLWPRMERSVDVFTTRWVDTATSACEARTTTNAFTHHAQRCLYEVAREADATLASLQRAPAAASREGPVRVEEWVNPAECLRPKFVLAAPVIPLLVRPRVRELEEALAAIGNDVSSGANAEDLARRLDEIRPELESLARSYPALRARQAMIEATLSRRDGRKMEAALKRAYHHARAASHAGYSAEAADRLVQLLAIQLGESKSAIEWAEVAQAEAARDGVSSERRVSIALAVAIAYDTAGRWDDAATGYEDALRAADRLTGTAHDHHRASILISLSGFEGAR